MDTPLTNPISETWTKWEGQGYPRAIDAHTALYYISGHLQNLAEPLHRQPLTDAVVLDGLFATPEKAQDELDKSYLFTGFVLLDTSGETLRLVYQEPKLATPGQVSYAVTWVEVRFAN